jgi:hydroxymethylglutaryl-CoA lyase
MESNKALITHHSKLIIQNSIKLIECPRDAMQGIHDFIPTDLKITYLNALLKVGFDTLDFGSFVSPKVLPQMKDTAQVLAGLDLRESLTKLLAIIANVRGAEEACQYEQITYLGFPLSLSETFQQRNTNKTIAEAFEQLKEIQELCVKHHKILVVYLSMGFGNPYGDPYDVAYLEEFVTKLKLLEVKIVCPSDTIGVSAPDNITYLFSTLIKRFPEIEFGAHLHSTPATAVEKIEAAYKAGCVRFDGAIRGYGGCPMAKDELTGNMATEKIISYFESLSIDLKIDKNKFASAVQLSEQVFPL